MRKQGKDVRITAQLIDIFKVQEEIALAITDALMGILGMRQVAVSVPTENLDARVSWNWESSTISCRCGKRRATLGAALAFRMRMGIA